MRDQIWHRGARPAIPGLRHEAPVACPPWIYSNRNRVERLWARLKEGWAVATRHEKTASSFTAVLCRAATCDWIKTEQALTPQQVFGWRREARRALEAAGETAPMAFVPAVVAEATSAPAHPSRRSRRS